MTSFDLAAYLERLALREPLAPDAAGLLRLQHAHRLAIPFENLDVALGRPIRIDGAGVFAKLVTARRGGYCFEHNRLFLDALAALGFAARPLLGRVLLGADADQVPPRKHALVLVTIDGRGWIADAGFGGTYTPPMPLADGAEAAAPDGARFRLADIGRGEWLLLREGEPGTTDGRPAPEGAQYSFTLDEAYPADFAMGNWWSSTHPEARFVRHRVVSLVLPRGFVSLVDRRYRRRNGDRLSEGEIDDPRVYRMRLGLLFGIQLSADEVMRLGLFG